MSLKIVDDQIGAVVRGSQFFIGGYRVLQLSPERSGQARVGRFEHLRLRQSGGHFVLQGFDDQDLHFAVGYEAAKFFVLPDRGLSGLGRGQTFGRSGQQPVLVWLGRKTG